MSYYKRYCTNSKTTRYELSDKSSIISALQESPEDAGPSPRQTAAFVRETLSENTELSGAM